MPKDLIIDDSTDPDLVFPTSHARGLVPRDLSVDPPHLFGDPPGDMDLIPESEWDARIKEQEDQQSSLEHLRMKAANGQPIPSLDQNGQGFCWAYSIGMTIMLSRAVAGEPYVRLSPHAVACKIKGFRDEGGWCGLSAKFARETGYPSVNVWPEKSMKRAYDTPVTWEDAAKHKITEDWVDLAKPVYDQNLTFKQLATCLLLNIPCAVDFNWWSHSVCGIRLVKVEAGSYGIKILNSWTDSWGDRGMGILRGGKELPDGAIATRVTTAS